MKLLKDQAEQRAVAVVSKLGFRRTNLNNRQEILTGQMTAFEIHIYSGACAIFLKKNCSNTKEAFKSQFLVLIKSSDANCA